MQTEKFMIILDKVFINVNKILSYLEITITPEDDNFSSTTQNFLVFYFSKYKFKLENKNSKQENSHILNFINDSLKLINCKFLISGKLTKIEFINFILYFFINYDVIGNYIDYLSNLNKKYINVSIENIFERFEDLDIDFSKKSDQFNFLQSYNKFNMTCKNLKKQIDSFINLSYKLNEYKKSQESPVK